MGCGGWWLVVACAVGAECVVGVGGLQMLEDSAESEILEELQHTVFLRSVEHKRRTDANLRGERRQGKVRYGKVR